MFKVPSTTAISALRFTSRSITTSAPLAGKRNFRKFLLYNKRGTRLFKQQRITQPDPDLPIDKRGVRDTGYHLNGKFIEFPEMIPQIVVPDLTGCQLKPYVSYKTPEVIQSEFTSQDLFNAVYSSKIVADFKAGKLSEDGAPVEPSPEEQQTTDDAWVKARRTGSDIF